MRELLRTNDPVLISFVSSLLKEAGIDAHVMDQNMSVMEGSIGAIQQRILVPADSLQQARRIMRDADLGHWINLDQDRA